MSNVDELKAQNAIVDASGIDLPKGGKQVQRRRGSPVLGSLTRQHESVVVDVQTTSPRLWKRRWSSITASTTKARNFSPRQYCGRPLGSFHSHMVQKVVVLRWILRTAGVGAARDASASCESPRAELAWGLPTARDVLGVLPLRFGHRELGRQGTVLARRPCSAKPVRA